MLDVAVVGDIVLDHSQYYRTGERQNPENHLVPLVKGSTLREETKLWGAANLAANIKAMVGKVLLAGPYNTHDLLSSLMLDICKKSDIEFQGMRTTAPVIVKHRLYVDNMPILRIDEGDDKKIAILSDEKQRIVKVLLHRKPSYVVISDYLKWVIDEELVELLKQGAKEIGSRILVDTKPKNLDLFGGVYLIKPNFKEFREMTGNASLKNEDEDIEREGKIFVEKYKTNLVVTRSEKWATLITQDREAFHLVPHTDEHGLVDVTGAGDTFLAGVVAGLVRGLPLQNAVELGNKASGIAVKQQWTSVVTAAQLDA